MTSLHSSGWEWKGECWGLLRLFLRPVWEEPAISFVEPAFEKHTALRRNKCGNDFWVSRCGRSFHCSSHTLMKWLPELCCLIETHTGVYRKLFSQKHSFSLHYFMSHQTIMSVLKTCRLSVLLSPNLSYCRFYNKQFSQEVSILSSVEPWLGGDCHCCVSTLFTFSGTMQWILP